MLFQNYPYTFNPSTVISYSLPKKSNDTLRVHNLINDGVAALVDETLEQGYYEVTFSNDELAGSIYLFRFSACEFVDMKKDDFTGINSIIGCGLMLKLF